ARATEILGDDEALEAELLAHLLPDGGVVAVFGLHQAPDLGLGRLLVEEGADGLAELFLLLAEGEVHGAILHRAPIRYRIAVCTPVLQSVGDGPARDPGAAQRHRLGRAA